jgi:hypothetical protein
MEKANNSLYQLGSATYAAKRAADIVFVLQNKGHLNYSALISRLNEVLQAYGEQGSEVSSADLDDLKAVSRKLYAVFEAEWFAASSAMALAVLLAEKQYNPGGLCASSSCGRPFIDLGKGGGRNYCSPRCATRERVAAYRKTKKTATTLPDSNLK